MIDQVLAEFLGDGVALHLGTRNEALEPNGARAVAVTVDDDGEHVVVFVPKVAARRLVGDLESNGHATLVVVRPIDDRACQIKGRFVSARPATRAERPAVEAQRDRFLANLERIGVARALEANWAWWPAVAIRLRATALFTQTPGPDAGSPLA